MLIELVSKKKALEEKLNVVDKKNASLEDSMKILQDVFNYGQKPRENNNNLKRESKDLKLKFNIMLIMLFVLLITLVSETKSKGKNGGSILICLN